MDLQANNTGKDRLNKRSVTMVIFIIISLLAFSIVNGWLSLGPDRSRLDILKRTQREISRGKTVSWVTLQKDLTATGFIVDPGVQDGSHPFSRDSDHRFLDPFAYTIEGTVVVSNGIVVQLHFETASRSF